MTLGALSNPLESLVSRPLLALDENQCVSEFIKENTWNLSMLSVTKVSFPGRTISSRHSTHLVRGTGVSASTHTADKTQV